MKKEYYLDQKIYKIFDDERKRSFINDNIIKVKNDPKFEGYYLAKTDKNETLLFSDNVKIIHRFPANFKNATMEGFLVYLVSQPDIVKKLEKIKDLKFLADKNIEKAMINTLCLSKLLEEKEARGDEEALKQINQKYNSQVVKEIKDYLRSKRVVFNNRQKIKTQKTKNAEEKTK